MYPCPWSRIQDILFFRHPVRCFENNTQIMFIYHVRELKTTIIFLCVCACPRKSTLIIVIFVSVWPRCQVITSRPRGQHVHSLLVRHCVHKGRWHLIPNLLSKQNAYLSIVIILFDLIVFICMCKYRIDMILYFIYYYYFSKYLSIKLIIPFNIIKFHLSSWIKQTRILKLNVRSSRDVGTRWCSGSMFWHHRSYSEDDRTIERF